MQRRDWSEVADISAGIALWGSIFTWIGYTIYTQGFTEPVTWALAAISCFVVGVYIIFSADMELGACFAAVFMVALIYIAFMGAALFRSVQYLLF